MPVTTRWQVTPTLKWLFVGCIVLTLPLIWSPHRDWQYHALPRLIGLWGGLFVYFSLLQCKISSRQWIIIWTCIVFGTLFQSLFVIGEIFFSSLMPELSQTMARKIGYGIFQQRNVTASYLATGLALSLGLLIEGHFSLKRSKLDWIHPLFLGVSVMLLSAVLLMLYSRIGWIGWAVSIIFVYAALFFLPSLNISSYRRWIICILPIVGLAIGYELSLFEPSQIKHPHDASNFQRWFTLKVCWHMFIESPLRGWGYGGFEYVFQHWVAKQIPRLDTHEMMNHPHNEIVYWTIEGGITSLVGLMIIVVAGIKCVFQKGANASLLIIISLLPILLHTQVEYPFYLSSAHWLIVLLLLTACDYTNTRNQKLKFKNSKWFHKGLSLCLATLALCGSLCCAVALYNEIELTQFEIRKLANDESIVTLPLPWLNYERYMYDIALLNIVRFQKTADPQALNEFVTISHKWLKIHVDPDMFQNLVSIERYLGFLDLAEKDNNEARYLFPYDKRF